MSHRKWARPNRRGKEWTGTEVQRLKQMTKSNTPTPLIADALNRTEDAVRSKASRENISLQPPNRSPYNRRKK